MKPDIVKCDVLVVGGGVAAVSALRSACRDEVTVCQVVKGSFGSVGIRGAGASCCGCTEDGGPRLPDLRGGEYDADLLFKKILQAGLGLADPKLVKILLEDAEKTSRGLIKAGINFNGTGPLTLGYPIVQAFLPRIENSVTHTFENTMIVDLVVKDGGCAGAIGIDGTGRIVLFSTPAVVLATGGNAQLFKFNVHPDCVTGDGYAMAFRAGARLMNMEFMQILFCTAGPTRNLFHAYTQDTLSNIYNCNGHHFLEDYLPEGISVEECIEQNLKHAPFSTRDSASKYLAIGIVKEIQKGRGTPDGGVWLDLRGKTSNLTQKQVRFLHFKGVEIQRMPVQLTMGHQCSNGGIIVDEHAMTTIPGVFAAGEVATGMHGADRIGGNMLTACLVFGNRAGNNAALWSKLHQSDKKHLDVPEIILDEIQKLSSSRGKTKPWVLIERLKMSAWNNCLTVKSENSLMEFLRELDEIKRESMDKLSLETPSEKIQALELRNLLLVGEMVATSALKRKESRGPHYREDYPHCNLEMPPGAIVLCAKKGGKLHFEEKTIDPCWCHTEHMLSGSRWG